MRDAILEGILASLLWIVGLLGLIMFASIVFQGCATPLHWTASTHMEMLQTCRAACGPELVRSYDSMSAECKCYKGYPDYEQDSN